MGLLSERSLTGLAAAPHTGKQVRRRSLPQFAGVEILVFFVMAVGFALGYLVAQRQVQHWEKLPGYRSYFHLPPLVQKR